MMRYFLLRILLSLAKKLGSKNAEKNSNSKMLAGFSKYNKQRLLLIKLLVHKLASCISFAPTRVANDSQQTDVRRQTDS